MVRFWVKHSVENFFKKYQVILSLMGREGEGTEIATMPSTNSSLKYLYRKLIVLKSTM